MGSKSIFSKLADRPILSAFLFFLVLLVGIPILSMFTIFRNVNVNDDPHGVGGGLIVFFVVILTPVISSILSIILWLGLKNRLNKRLL